MMNKTKIIIGLGLMLCAFMAAMTAFYFINAQATANLKEVDVLQVQLANLIAEKAEVHLPASDLARVQRERFNIEDFVLRTEKVYGESELKRREGILWIDRSTAACMITLGAANGLAPGSSVSVYDEVLNPSGLATSQKIAEIVVEKTFDIVSYVTIADKNLNDFNRDYYRVTVKDIL